MASCIFFFYSAGDCVSHNQTSSPSQKPRSVHYETPPIRPQHIVQNLPCQRNTPTPWRIRSPEYPTCLIKHPRNSPESGCPNSRLINTPRKQQGTTSKRTRWILAGFMTPWRPSVNWKQRWPKGSNQHPVLGRSTRPQRSNLDPTLNAPRPRWLCPVWTDTRSKGRRANTNTETRWEKHMSAVPLLRSIWRLGDLDYVYLSRRKAGGETRKKGEKIQIWWLQTTKSPQTAQVSTLSCRSVTWRAETWQWWCYQVGSDTSPLDIINGYPSSKVVSMFIHMMNDGLMNYSLRHVLHLKSHLRPLEQSVFVVHLFRSAQFGDNWPET